MKLLLVVAGVFLCIAGHPILGVVCIVVGVVA